MKTREVAFDRLLISLRLILLLALASFCHLHADGITLTERAKIEVLIKLVEGLKDATFIRNGGEYNAKVAAMFLRTKWKSHEKEINTARDFIEKQATTSSTSGKPYLIRFKHGPEVRCGEYLLEKLQRLE